MDADPRARIVACIGDTLREMGLLEGATLDASTGLFGQGIGLDSIETLKIVMALEEAFGLTIEDDALHPDHFRTIGALTRFVESLLQ